MKQHTVTIKGIDLELLKKQKEKLLLVIQNEELDFETNLLESTKENVEALDGILNLLDAITDQIEDNPALESETQYYASENLSTPLRQEVNKIITDKVSDIASDLVRGDIEYPFDEYDETNETEEVYTEEAQKLFNEYYANEMDSMYKFVNDIKLTESIFNIPARIKQTEL